jgi:hypothetical protein
MLRMKAIGSSKTWYLPAKLHRIMLQKNIIKLSLHLGTIKGLKDTTPHILHTRLRWICDQLHVPAAFTPVNKPLIFSKDKLVLKQEAQHLVLTPCSFLFQPFTIMRFFSFQEKTFSHFCFFLLAFLQCFC